METVLELGCKTVFRPLSIPNVRLKMVGFHFCLQSKEPGTGWFMTWNNLCLVVLESGSLQSRGQGLGRTLSWPVGCYPLIAPSPGRRGVRNRSEVPFMLTLQHPHDLITLIRWSNHPASGHLPIVGLDSQYAFQEVAYALHNGWFKVGKLTLPFQRLAALEEAIASDPQIVGIKLKKKKKKTKQSNSVNWNFNS